MLTIFWSQRYVGGKKGVENLLADANPSQNTRFRALTRTGIRETAELPQQAWKPPILSGLNHAFWKFVAQTSSLQISFHGN